MEERASFNLVDEPWIRARGDDGVVKELSILDLFRQAPKLRCLANDLPTQDFAILRVLLAILQRAISPMIDDLDEDVEPSDLWGQLWNAPELPMESIEAYLAKWHNRFDLFDQERPFMQVPGLRKPKDELSPVKKIIADVPDNDSLFSLRSNYALEYLAFAEAARWLIHVQAFDTAGIKSGVLDDPNASGSRSYSKGTSWAGNLGGLFVEGNSLIETLLLNLILCSTEDSEFFSDEDLPVWERPLRSFGDLGRVPTGHADIFTWQSRRIRLVQQHGVVNGLVLTNGDKLEARNMHRFEPMTAWRRSANQKKKLGMAPVYLPIKHGASRSLWRGLSSVFSVESNEEKAGTFVPGILSWVGFLASNDGGRWLSQKALLQVHGVGFEYGNKSSVFAEVIDDAIQLSSFLLSPEGLPLVRLACDCVDKTDQAVAALGHLAANISIASGANQPNANDLADKVRAEAYFKLDPLFRRWLADLGIDGDAIVAREQWYLRVRETLSSIARGYVIEAGPDAIVGSLKKGGRGKTDIWVTAPRAEAWFHSALKRALPLERDMTWKEGHPGEE